MREHLQAFTVPTARQILSAASACWEFSFQRHWKDIPLLQDIPQPTAVRKLFIPLESRVSKTDYQSVTRAICYKDSFVLRRTTWMLSISCGLKRKWTSWRFFRLWLLLNPNARSNINLETMVLGNPNPPVPIAGKVIDFSPRFSVSFKQELITSSRTCKTHKGYFFSERHSLLLVPKKPVWQAALSTSRHL